MRYRLICIEILTENLWISRKWPDYEMCDKRRSEFFLSYTFQIPKCILFLWYGWRFREIDYFSRSCPNVTFIPIIYKSMYYIIESIVCSHNALQSQISAFCDGYPLFMFSAKPRIINIHDTPSLQELKKYSIKLWYFSFHHRKISALGFAWRGDRHAKDILV